MGKTQTLPEKPLCPKNMHTRPQRLGTGLSSKWSPATCHVDALTAHPGMSGEDIVQLARLNMDCDTGASTYSASR